MDKIRYLVFAALAGLLVFMSRTEITLPQAEGAPIFAPVNAPYVVTNPNDALTSEVLTTALTSDLVADSAGRKLGSVSIPWSDVYATFGRFFGVVTDTVSSTGALSLSSGGNISLTPSGTETVNIGGDSIVVASKPNPPSLATAGQIYFDTALNQFRGFNGTSWVALSQSIPGVPVNGLISYWKLDESSDGSSAVSRIDSKGSNHLTDNNTTASAVGKVNNSNGADFQQINSEYLSIADASQSGLDLSTDFSVSFWLNLKSLDSSAAVVAKDSSDSRGYNIALQAADGRVLVEFWNGNANPANLSFFKSDAGVVTVGVWQHYVITVDISMPAVQIYKDGVAINANAVNTNATVLQNSSGVLAIGRQGSFDAAYLDGIVDEVGIWNRALSPSEVEDLFNNGNGSTY